MVARAVDLGLLGAVAVEAIARVEGRVAARRSLLGFAERMFPGYQVAPHHRAVADALEAVERGDVDRLAVTLPPRHGKSLLCSHLFPAWFLGRNPDKRVIGTSYAASLAYRFSRQARNALADLRSPFPTVRPAPDLANVQTWDLDGRQGGYVAAGVGGAITGFGADLLLIDDPVKNAEEAESEAYRERAWEWFTQAALTRLHPGAAVVLVGTRWHEDDLIGRALAMDGAGWERLDLPALAEPGDVLGRPPDAPLWPERYDAAALARIKTQIGSRAWASLYQQRPSPPEGAILKREWWSFYQPAETPLFSWVLQVWDTAFKTGQGNDWSVCETWGLADDGFYLLDLWRARVEFPTLKRAVVDQYTRHRPDEVLIEDAASGQSLIQALDDETTLPIVPFKPDRDKVARVNAISPYVEAGKAKLPAGAAWLDEFIEEHAAFPFGAHDDQVDDTAMALARLGLRAVRPLDAATLSHFVGMPG